MNKKQKEGYRLHRRIVDAAEQGDVNETMALLKTIKTDFAGEVYQGVNLFLHNHLWLPLYLLMDSGADAMPNDRYQCAQYAALGAAATGGHIALVQAVLALGLDPTSKAMFMFGLQRAILGDNVGVVELLLNYGIDINTWYPRQLTAPELSILQAEGRKSDHQDENMTKFLLARGAVCTPFALVLAAGYGNVEVLRLLLAQGCDVNARAYMNVLPFRQNKYKTPLEVAREDCPLPYRSTVIQMLLDVGATS